MTPRTQKILVVGPFRGAPTEHLRIPVNQGICGAAVAQDATLIVDDVSADPRYLACSLETRSEIVVPIRVHGSVIGEIDIDSHDPAAFSREDKDFLEECARIVAALWNAPRWSKTSHNLKERHQVKSVVAIRHVHFEGLGSLASVLEELAYITSYLDIGKDDLSTLDPLHPDLLVVLGAPVGVYETDVYPFLATERELLAKRLEANLPTLGICLGAQQMACTLGASVAPSGHKEIGFAPVELTPEGKASPLRHLEGIDVLHWHGDAFEIPDGAARLAQTSLCHNQAFRLGRNILGLQFHPEIDEAHKLEAWLIGHAAELAVASIDPRTIRADGARYISRLNAAARKLFREWLTQLGQSPLQISK